MKKFYLNEEEITEEEFNKQLEGCVNEYASKDYDGLIDEAYEPFKVVGTTLYASTILKKCDPVVYRCCVDSYASSIMDKVKCELEKHGYYEINGDTFEIEEEEEEEE